MAHTVVAFGTFDIIHPGHIMYLAYAASMGRTLIVVITPDNAVARRKGSAPFFSQQERMRMVRSLKGVSNVVLGDEDDSWKKVKSIHADTVCFGYDQKPAIGAFRDALADSARVRTRIMRAPAYRPKRYHSKNFKRLP
jgi:FAD synthetase